jgi:hypothetical protein
MFRNRPPSFSLVEAVSISETSFNFYELDSATSQKTVIFRVTKLLNETWMNYETATIKSLVRSYLLTEEMLLESERP